jgi:hypothetical protein
MEPNEFHLAKRRDEHHSRAEPGEKADTGHSGVLFERPIPWEILADSVSIVSVNGRDLSRQSINARFTLRSAGRMAGKEAKKTEEAQGTEGT